MKALFINAKEKSFWIENIEHEKIMGILDLGIFLHMERYKSYEKDVFSEENAVIIGRGKLNYGGTQRGVFVFRSPLHGGLHSSTMGDLGEYFKRAGIDAICIEGKADLPVFVAIVNNEVKFIDSEIPDNIFAKEKELYSKVRDIYEDKPFRIVLTGKAAENTVYACVVSSKPNRIGVIPDVAGRGGAGSVLVRAHNVVGFSVGGDNPLEIETNAELAREQIEATKKYREKGTFAANYPHLEANTIIMNWTSLLLPRAKRKELFEKLIKEELLKNYSFNSETCGERCVAVCKKFECDVKVDYEPAEGLGPFIGIFNRVYIRELIHLVDAYGMDAIYLGNVLGVVFEALHKDVLPLELFSLSEKPSMDINSPSSEKNFLIAKYLIDKIASGEFQTLGEGIRKFSKELGIQEFALYVPHGKEFDMTPNFYWSLGLILPIVMHGKYFSDYHTIVKPPEEYAKTCAERTIKEYVLDNLGICRFHRGWMEKRLENVHLENAKYWITKLWEYKEKADALPDFWESSKTLSVVKKLFEEHGSGEWQNVDEDKLKEYWQRWQDTYFKELGIRE
jgi:glyceraldehyde-3-phosphate dehydrogenase (ferredoxin)